MHVCCFCFFDHKPKALFYALRSCDTLIKAKALTNVRAFRYRDRIVDLGLFYKALAEPLRLHGKFILLNFENFLEIQKKFLVYIDFSLPAAVLLARRYRNDGLIYFPVAVTARDEAKPKQELRRQARTARVRFIRITALWSN